MYRSSRIRILTFLSLCALSSATLYSQDPPRIAIPQLEQQSSSASVTGRVVCADTQHPARFANVMLIPVEEATIETRDRGNSGRRSGARTDLDGVFTAANVQPGDYYVSASATGYVSEASLLVAAGADPASALAKLPTVHVSAGSPSTINVSLERGSVIAGRILWDDGTSAAGVQVSAVSATATNGNQNGRPRLVGFFGGLGGDMGETDDRGQFRLTGLAPGSYLVRANVQTPLPSDGSGRGFGGRTASIAMYAPGKVRRTEAQTVTLRTGEERGDIAMVMDIASLHRVTGHVGATSGSVASGTVRLVDTTDSSLSRVAQISADGSYMLSYVPVGSYTLSVPFASSTPGQTGRQRGGGDGQNASSGTTFQPFQEALSVIDGDLTGVDINLSPTAQAAK